jgi:hypothetical protein
VNGAPVIPPPPKNWLITIFGETASRDLGTLSSDRAAVSNGNKKPLNNAADTAMEIKNFFIFSLLLHIRLRSGRTA